MFTSIIKGLSGTKTVDYNEICQMLNSWWI